MISGSIINKSSFSGIYLLGAGFMVLVLFIFILFLRDFKDPNIKSFILNNKIFIQNKNISKIYLSHLILQFFTPDDNLYANIFA